MSLEPMIACLIWIFSRLTSRDTGSTQRTAVCGEQLSSKIGFDIAFDLFYFILRQAPPRKIFKKSV